MCSYRNKMKEREWKYEVQPLVCTLHGMLKSRTERRSARMVDVRFNCENMATILPQYTCFMVHNCALLGKRGMHGARRNLGSFHVPHAYLHLPTHRTTSPSLPLPAAFLASVAKRAAQCPSEGLLQTMSLGCVAMMQYKFPLRVMQAIYARYRANAMTRWRIKVWSTGLKVKLNRVLTDPVNSTRVGHGVSNTSMHIHCYKVELWPQFSSTGK
jgi:hypothetical protein